MITPRYYQDEAADRTIQWLFDCLTNPLIALPTGTGKSVVIALFIWKCLSRWGNLKFLCLTHVKELVEQNAKKMATCCPHLPIGVNCDGLGRRDWAQGVVFGSVGSVIGMLKMFGKVDVLVIDEAHLASDKELSQYQVIIRFFQTINPDFRVVGLTATPFDNYGSMVKHNEETGDLESLFGGICYDRTKPEDYVEFIANGWLAPLSAHATRTKYDVSGVGMTGGDYNQGQLQKAVDKEELTSAAVSEIIHTANTKNRHCWLTFCSGIDHAVHANEELQSQGINSVVVHSKMKEKERDEAFRGFRAGYYQSLVNNGIATTGFDHPPVDLINIINHTTSIRKWGQMLGRGTRPYDWLNPEQYIPGFEYTKGNCLVNDFADNTSRLGPIDKPFFKKRKKGDTGDAPVKICGAKLWNGEQCGAYNYASARYCYECEAEFVFEVKFSSHTSGESVMSSGEAQTEWRNVSFVGYEKFVGPQGVPMLRVVYNSVGYKKSPSDLVCIEHTTNARRHAISWWLQRAGVAPPETVDQALSVASTLLNRPKRVLVQTDLKWPKVLNYEF